MGSASEVFSRTKVCPYTSTELKDSQEKELIRKQVHGCKIGDVDRSSAPADMLPHPHHRQLKLNWGLRSRGDERGRSRRLGSYRARRPDTDTNLPGKRWELLIWNPNESGFERAGTTIQVNSNAYEWIATVSLQFTGSDLIRTPRLRGALARVANAPPTTSTTAFTSCLPPCYNCYYCNIYVSLLQLDISPIPQYDVGSDLKRFIRLYRLTDALRRRLGDGEIGRKDNDEFAEDNGNQIIGPQ